MTGADLVQTRFLAGECISIYPNNNLIDVKTKKKYVTKPNYNILWIRISNKKNGWAELNISTQRKREGFE